MAWRLWNAIAGTVFAAAASMTAHANSPEPSRETFAAVVKTCTTGGGFGYRSATSLQCARHRPANHSSSKRCRRATTGCSKSSPSPPSPRRRCRGKTALLWRAGWCANSMPTSLPLANFARREPRHDGVQFVAASVVFDISRDGTEVHLTCTDIARKRAAKDAKLQAALIIEAVKILLLNAP